MWRMPDLRDHEGLDPASVGNMGTYAEVHHRSATVDSRGGAVGNFSLNDVLLVLVVLCVSVSIVFVKVAKTNAPRTSPAESLLTRRGARISASP